MNAGIYQIVNTKNNKRYIGSAWDLSRRKSDHFSMLRTNCHHSIYLQRSYDKYGKDSFKFEIILYCPKNNVENRMLLEQKCIDSCKPEYNMNPNALSSQGAKRRPETCKKIGDAKRGDKNPRYWKGKKRKEEVKEKIAETLKEYYKNNPHPLEGKTNIHSKEGLKSLSDKAKEGTARKGKFLYKDIIQMDMKGKEIGQYKSAVEAQNAIGKEKPASSKILRACKEPEKRSAYGFKWKFKSPEKYL